MTFHSKELSFVCWVNTYFFENECSRTLPKILKKPQVCVELEIPELDKLHTKLQDFSVVIMGYDIRKQ